MPDMKPGNIAQNIGNLLQAQQSVSSETVTKESVRENLEKAKEETKPVFKGFSNKKSIAKAAIELPVTRIQLRHSSIIYREEVNLAQTIIKEEDLFMDLLKLLWNHIVEGPEKIVKSFESFLENVAEPDVDAMLYGFYLTSYGPEVKTNETVVCSACGGKKVIDGFNLVSLYQDTPYPGEAFESIKTEKALKLDDEEQDVTFYFRFPSLQRTTSNKNVSKNNFLNELAGNSIANHTSRFVVVDNGEAKEYSDVDSIKTAIETLSVNSRKKVKKFLQENFFIYGIRFEYNWTCNNQVPDPEAINEKAKKTCGHVNKRRYSINDLFFREISESVS